MESWEETDERSTAGDLTRVDTFGALKHDVNSTVELYSYDGFNRMAEARKGAMTATYQYNAEGIRTSKTVNGVRTDFLLDGANVIAETKNGTTTNYIRGVSGIISSSVFGSNSLTKYYTSDGHGNITNLTNSSGDVVKTYVYDAFGVEQNIDLNDLNPFRYCGEYYDSEINQIYLRARYYNPSLGRFTQSDPARDGMNWYVYCGNNPVVFFDPTGMVICLKNGYGLEYIHMLTGDAGYQLDENNELYYNPELSTKVNENSALGKELLNAIMQSDEWVQIDLNSNFQDNSTVVVSVGGSYKRNKIDIDNRTGTDEEVLAALSHEMAHAFVDAYDMSDKILTAYDSNLSETEKIALSAEISRKYSEAIAITVEMQVRSDFNCGSRAENMGTIGVNAYAQFPANLTMNPNELDSQGTPFYGRVKATTIKSYGTGIVHYITAKLWRD